MSLPGRKVAIFICRIPWPAPPDLYVDLMNRSGPKDQPTQTSWISGLIVYEHVTIYYQQILGTTFADHSCLSLPALDLDLSPRDNMTARLPE
jgi:hypothetical protein